MIIHKKLMMFMKIWKTIYNPTKNNNSDNNINSV